MNPWFESPPSPPPPTRGLRHLIMHDSGWLVEVDQRLEKVGQSPYEVGGEGVTQHVRHLNNIKYHN